MILSLIVALSDNFAIGKANQLPWHLPDDLKFFKKNTLDKPIIMGRKTFESLGKPLPNRLNIVLSRSAIALPEGVLLFNTLETAILFLENQNMAEAMIIGGGELYKQALSLVNQLYLTRVHAEIVAADTFFPKIDFNQWHLKSSEKHPTDERHAYSFSFEIWEKKS